MAMKEIKNIADVGVRAKHGSHGLIPTGRK